MTDAKSESNNSIQLHRDTVVRVILNFAAWGATAFYFAGGLNKASESMERGIEKITNQQQQVVDELGKLRTAEETLAEHVRFQDQLRAEDRHRLEKLEDVHK
jgi:hypothetical protein